jgi:hypothetical protein
MAVFMPAPPRGAMRWAASAARKPRPCRYRSAICAANGKLSSRSMRTGRSLIPAARATKVGELILAEVSEPGLASGPLPGDPPAETASPPGRSRSNPSRQFLEAPPDLTRIADELAQVLQAAMT